MLIDRFSFFFSSFWERRLVLDTLGLLHFYGISERRLQKFHLFCAFMAGVGGIKGKRSLVF